MLCSIGELALLLGVSVITLRRWHAAGSLVPVSRTPGGHRRYDIAEVREQFGIELSLERKTVAYARVSSHDQSEHLKTQAKRLEQHCEAQGYANLEVVTDLGSGMNYKKKGQQRLLLAILRGEVQRVVLVTKDRLLRFGSELLFSICKFFSVAVEVLDADIDCSREQQLTEDLLEILTVFSSRLYGSRSRKNLKAVAAAKN
jgi:predicted site-specific integrase-resolvase